MFNQYIQNDYLRALAVFVFVFVLTRVIISIFERIALRLAKKTKTELDDLLIKKASLPITFIVLFVAVKIALKEIILSASTELLISKTVYTVFIILIAYLVYVFFHIVVFELWKNVVKRANTKTIESLSSLMHGILEVILIIFAILYILNVWGVEITPLLAGLGIAGLAVALAIQPTLSNIFSGIAMILDDSIRVGDLVNIDANTKGKIQKIGLRSTKIVTFDNELVIVPNTKFADSYIQNIALPEPKSRVTIPFSVAYGTDINKVKTIVLDEIKSINKACKTPEPKLRFIDMGASALNFKAFFYVETYDDRADAIDEANTKIYNILRKNRIEIPYNKLDVYMRKD